MAELNNIFTMIPLQLQAHLSHGNAPELGAGVIIHRQVRPIMTALERAYDYLCGAIILERNCGKRDKIQGVISWSLGWN